MPRLPGWFRKRLLEIIENIFKKFTPSKKYLIYILIYVNLIESRPTNKGRTLRRFSIYGFVIMD